MMGIRARLQRIGLIIFLLGIIAVLSVFLLARFTPLVDRSLESALNFFVDANLQIQFEDVSGNPLSGLQIRQFRLIFQQDTLHVPRVVVQYRMADLLQGKLTLSRLLLFQPAFTHVAAPGGSDPGEVDTSFLYQQLQKIPPIQLGQLVIQDGRFTWRDSTTVDRWEKIYVDLKAQLTPERVEIRPRYFRAYWATRAYRLESLSFHLIGNKKRITINQLEARFPGGVLVAHGEVEFFPRTRFLFFADTSQFALSLAKTVYPGLPFREGFLRIYGSFIGTPERYHGELFLQAQLDSLHIRRLHTWYEKQNDRYYLQDLVWRSNFGDAEGELIYARRGENRAHLRFREVNLQPIGLARFPTRLNGTVALQFDRWDFQRISGQGKLSLTNVQFGQARLDSILLSLQAQKGNWRFKKPSRLVVGPGSSFHLQGSLTRKGWLEVVLQTKQNNLDTLFHRIQIAGAGGRGQFQLQVTGPVNNPDVFGQLAVDTLRLPGTELWDLTGTVAIRHVLHRREGTSRFHLRHGQFRAMEITRGKLQMHLQDNQIWLDTLEFQNRQNRIFARGRVSLVGDSVQMALDRFYFVYRDYEVTNRTPLLASYLKGRIDLQQIQLTTTGGGTLTLAGHYFPRGASSLQVDVQGVRLEPFNQFIQWKYDLTGQLSLALSLQGTVQHPQLQARLLVKDFALDGHPVGSLLATTRLYQQRVVLEELVVQDTLGARLQVQGTLPLHTGSEPFQWQLDLAAPFQLSLQLDSVRLQNFAFLLAVNYPFRGEVSGKVELEGSLQSPIGRYLLDAARMQIYEYAFPQIHLDGRVTPNRLLVDFGRINFMNTVLLLNGYKLIRWDLHQPDQLFSDPRFKAHVVIKEDSVNFLNVFLPDVDRILGNIQAELWLGGDITDPQVQSGHLLVEDGVLYLSRLENPLQNLFIEAHMDENGWLAIERFEGISRKSKQEGGFFRRFLRKISSPIAALLGIHRPKGDVRLTGRVNLKQLLRPRFQLQVQLKGAYVHYFVENVRLTLTSDNITITGQDTIRVEGQVLVEEGEVLVDFSESEKNVLLYGGVRETPPYLEYSLDLEIPGNFFVRSTTPFNSFDLQLAGNVRVSKLAKREMEVYGVLLIKKGTYFVQIEEFDIASGKIEFVNPKELPEMEIFAQRRKYGLRFDLIVRGKLDNPQKEIHIYDARTGQELPYTDVKDQMALLMFGVPFDQLGQAGETVLRSKGQEVLYQTAASLIEREARHFIGLDQVRIESSSQFHAQRLNEISQLALGKYLTPNLYLEFKTALGGGRIPTPQLNWEAGNQIYLEYQLSRNLRISTIYEKLTERNDRVRLDISWRYEF